MAMNATMMAFQNRLRGRYAPVLDAQQNTHAAAMGTFDRLGAQQQADINRNYDMLGRQQQASLVNRGLANTTIGGTVAAGLARERTSALNRSTEQLAQQRLSYDVGIRNQMAQTIGQTADAQYAEQQAELERQRRMPYWTDRSGARHAGYFQA